LGLKIKLLRASSAHSLSCAYHWPCLSQLHRPGRRARYRHALRGLLQPPRPPIASCADPVQRSFLEETVGFTFDGSTQCAPLDVIAAISAGSGAHQSGRWTASKPGYYGCPLVRPPEITQFENPKIPP
jgi:hypothetical protein